MARIFECGFCSTVLATYGEALYEWFTGLPHTCAPRAEAANLFFLNAVADDALNGDAAAAHLLPEAVDAWLAL